MADKLLWSDDLLTGIDLVDGQHRQLFTQISRFLDACDQGEPKESLITTLEFFEHYVKLHFSAEERVQRDSGYPRFAEHQILHAALLGELNEFKDDLGREGVTPALVSTAIRFWTQWFAEHISVEDKAIADYFRTNPAATP